MSLQFGRASEARLETVVDELQRLARSVLALDIIDFSVAEGRRDKETQERYFRTGKSKVHWPKSKHNVLKPTDKARAFDLVPYVNGALSYNKLHCCVLAGAVLALAKERGLRIRWGGNWDQDHEPITDQDFQDLVHFELLQ